jgi:hypothetical protein
MRQSMRLAKTTQPGVDRKPTSALSSKLIDAMRERIIPIAMNIDTLPLKTRFVFTPQDVVDALIKDIQRDSPEIVQNKAVFFEELHAAYDRLLPI